MTVLVENTPPPKVMCEHIKKGCFHGDVLVSEDGLIVIKHKVCPAAAQVTQCGQTSHQGTLDRPGGEWGASQHGDRVFSLLTQHSYHQH